MKSLNSLQPLGLLVLRLVLALIFFSHGYPKVAHSAPGMQAFFVEHGLPGYFVYISGVMEVFGALLLALGVFTRVAALLLAVEMGVAIWRCTITNSPSRCSLQVSRSPRLARDSCPSTMCSSKAKASNGPGAFEVRQATPRA